jgi:hypothetical protein
MSVYAYALATIKEGGQVGCGTAGCLETSDTDHPVTRRKQSGQKEDTRPKYIFQSGRYFVVIPEIRSKIVHVLTFLRYYTA